MNDSYILDLLGALDQSKSKKQINADLKQLEKAINMLRLTGTFAKADTKRELNTYIKQLSNQLSTIKLKAQIDSKNLKTEINKALNNVSFKDIDALNIDENKTKLKIRKVIADAKAYANKTPIMVNIESKKTKLNNDLTAYLNRNTKINESSVLLKQAEKVRELINVIDDKKTLREATDAFQLYKSEVSATGFNAKSTTDKIKDMLGHVSKISSVFGIASMAVNNFAKSLKTLKSNDTILTEISKTSEMTKNQLKELGDEAFKVASKYGQLSSGYLLGVQEMARSGYEDASKELGELSLLAQSAGDMTADSANNYLLATDAAYKYSGSVEKLNAALDGANFISNRNSASLSDIADATRVSASFAANAEVAIDELTAAEATMIAVTKRAGTEIGRAFRSIVLNLQQVSGEFDGEVIDEEQLKKVEARCHSLGVELEYMKDGIATLRNPMEVLKELAEVYNSLPDNSADKQGLISDLGGKYHANALSSLLSRWDLYEKMLGEFSQGTGSALEEAEKTAKSWEGRLNSLQNSWDSFINTLTNKEIALDGISFFDRLIQGAESLVDIVGEIPVVLTAVNSSLVAMNKDYGITQLVNKDTGKFDIQGNLLGIDFSAIKEQKKHFSDAEGAILQWNDKLASGKADLESFNSSLVQNNAQLKDYLSTTSKEAPASLSGYKTYLNAAGISTDALRIKTILLNSAISMGIGFAIQAAVQGIAYLIQREEELRQATQESANAYKESASSIDDYTKRYQELHQALLEAKGNEEETYNIKKQLLDLQTELNDKFGEEYGKINLVTDAYKDQTEAIKAYNKEIANKTLNDIGEKGINDAKSQMLDKKKYNLGMDVSLYSDEGLAIQELADKYGIDINSSEGSGTFSLILKADATTAESTINDFMADVRSLRDNGDFDFTDSFDNVLDYSGSELKRVKDTIEQLGDALQQILIAEIIKDDDELARKYNNALETVEALNEAVLKSEDPFNDENVQKLRQDLEALKATFTTEELENYGYVLYDVFNQADTKLIDFHNELKNNSELQKLADNLRGLDNLDLESLNPGENASFDKLKESADEYKLSLAELIDELVRLGYVQTNATEENAIKELFSAFDSTEIGERLQYINSQFKAGEISYKEYFDALNSEIANVDFSNYTNSLEEANAASAQFFADSTQQAASGLSDLINKFDSGSMSVSEYLEGYLSIANTLSTLTNELQENSASWNQNGTAMSNATSNTLDNTQSALDNAISTIQSYQDSIYSLEQLMTGAVEAGTDEFSAHTQVIAEDLANIVATGGQMADEIASTLGTTTAEIASSMSENVSNQSLAAQAITANTNAAIGDMANSVGQLFDTLGNAISNFKVDISFGIKSISMQDVDMGLLGTHKLPKIDFSLEASGESLSAIGSAISSFGKSVASNMAPQMVELPDFSFKGDNKYMPDAGILDNYNKKLNDMKNAQKGAGKAAKDTNDALNAQKEALEAQKEALEAEKEALQEQKEAAAEALEEQIDGIDDIIKGKEKEIDLLDDEIDKIKEAREERKRDIELQKAQYDLARAENQRPKLVNYMPDAIVI